jgi:nitronate monooxygenase
MIGVGSAGSVEFLEAEAAVPQSAGVRFGIGLLDWRLRRDPTLLDAALRAAPTLLSVSFGDDWSWVRRVQDAHILTAAQVFDVESARRAVDAGVDVLVARGAEGGGHGEPKVGTLPLLEAVLDTVTLPVLAAGGISSYRGVAAVLGAGASGAWLGTAFAACPESLVSESKRDALIEAQETDTILTRVFDVALGYAWPSRFPSRVLRNEFSDQWAGREEALVFDATARASLESALTADDRRVAHVDAGQGVGLLRAAHPAGVLVERLSTGAAELLGAWAPQGEMRGT